MIDYLILDGKKVNKPFFKKTAVMVLKDHDIDEKEIYLSLAFLDKTEMRKVNCRYRKKDKPTDVISLELKNDNHDQSKNWLGEILICREVVLQNSKEDKKSFDSELAKVFIHGLLHVLGYDHELGNRQAKRMEDKEAFYLSKLGY